MSNFIIQISKGRCLKLLPISARLSTLFLTFLLTMGANCGQAPTELCLNGNPCDNAWLSYVAVSPNDGAEGVSSGSSVRLDFNRKYQRFNSSFASWSSAQGAVLFATEESEDKRSVTLTPSAELIPNTEYTLRVLAGAASASDGASSPILTITFTTGLPDLGVSLETTIGGPWTPAKLVFNQDVDPESLEEALQWRIGETVVEAHVFPVLKLADEASVEDGDSVVSEEPAPMEERSFWVVPRSRPSGTGPQVIVLSGALLSKGGDYQLNEERTFAIDTTPGQARSEQWTPPSPQIILSSELENGLYEFNLDAFPTDLQWVLLKAADVALESVELERLSLSQSGDASVVIDLSPWLMSEGVLALTWVLVDSDGESEVINATADFDFTPPAAPTLTAPAPTEWSYDALSFTVEVQEAGTLEVGVGLETPTSFAVEAGVNTVTIQLPRILGLYTIAFSLVELSGNRSELLLAEVERVPYPCLGTIVDGTLIQRLSGSNELVGFELEDDGEGDVSISVPLNLGLADDATLHGALTSRNFGGETEFLIRENPPMVSLITFDAELIPQCAQVEEATLVLTETSLCDGCPRPSSWDIAPLRVLWRETEVTWNVASDNQSWSQNGTGSEDVSESLSTGSWSGTRLSIGLEDDLNATVWSEGWFGLRLSQFDVNAGFHSTESANVAVRPRLRLSLQEIRE
ncbi:MAG: Ig-like domain-containing protein [Myxococcota bacterium]|nr:Ig-like domain-containing protein [Myxococcota bacterium]